MSLGEGHLTQIPAQELGPMCGRPGTRYQWCTLMSGWRELVQSLIAWRPWQVSLR